jgi:hypothetical protein
VLVSILLAATLTAGPAYPIDLYGRDMGPEPSAYTGRYYSPADEPYRLCIAEREGMFRYYGTGSNGYYVGTYQMTRALAHGAVWMASREWADQYGKRTARTMRKALHNTDPTKWSRRVWDQLFYTVLNWEGPRSGARHWAGGRWPCR